MQESWNIAVQSIRGEMDEKNFNTWIKPIEFKNFIDKKIELGVPNKFYKDWLTDHYKDLILTKLQEHSELKDLTLEFVLDNSSKFQISVEPPIEDSKF
jgi:chromosomal replication initiator protein